MLPPFVPPSARAAAEALPLITEFVVDRVDRSFEATFIPEEAVPITQGLAHGSEPHAPEPESAAGTEHHVSARESAIPAAEHEVEIEAAISDPVIEFALPGTLPSIEEFVMRDPYVEYPGAAAVSGKPETAPLVQLQQAQPQETPTEHTAEQLAEQQEAPVAWVTSRAPSVAPPAQDWIEAERNAFDWQSMAHLAPDSDVQRANDEWTSTDWDTPTATSSTADHVATMLMQVARRVRSGELKINVPRGMTTEVALAAALTALLAEPDTNAGAHGQE